MPFPEINMLAFIAVLPSSHFPTSPQSNPHPLLWLDGIDHSTGMSKCLSLTKQGVSAPPNSSGTSTWASQWKDWEFCWGNYQTRFTLYLWTRTTKQPMIKSRRMADLRHGKPPCPDGDLWIPASICDSWFPLDLQLGDQGDGSCLSSLTNGVSFIPGTQVMERKLTLTSCPLISPCPPWHTHPYIHTYVHKRDKM